MSALALAVSTRCCRRETDPEWEKDIESETKDECSKYGAVLHVHVDKNSKARPCPASAIIELITHDLHDVIQLHASNLFTKRHVLHAGNLGWPSCPRQKSIEMSLAAGAAGTCCGNMRCSTIHFLNAIIP